MWALELADSLALVSFALSGAWRAREKGLDLFGLVALAVLCAFGGGWMRDLLLDRGIPASLQSPSDLFLVIAVALLSLRLFYRPGSALDRAVIVTDALGLGLYSASAALLSLHAGLPVVSTCLLAVVAGTGGGVLRDLIVNEIPLIFRREVYALCAIAGALSVSGLHRLAVPESLQLLSGVGVTFLLRLAAIRRNWQLPARPASEG